MQLIPITTDQEEMQDYLRHEFTKSVFETWQKLYPVWGYNPPWVGFFAVRGADTVGVGGFKGPLKNNTVELAYGTIPEYEGQGVATKICQLLVKAAIEHTPSVFITARTLPKKCASTRILCKNNFKKQGLVDDPEDGPVWEWLWQGNLKITNFAKT
ncbi:MAG: N-acetyltransferase [Bacteroidetes bacterium]|nr:MAG: N-acetyltransferase [Bacteroidota bacterium]